MAGRGGIDQKASFTVQENKLLRRVYEKVPEGPPRRIIGKTRAPAGGKGGKAEGSSSRGAASSGSKKRKISL